ncbi:MAG: hypothetical protein P8Y70_03405 [Candidatus Lokiarchaeota archaeon]
MEDLKEIAMKIYKAIFENKRDLNIEDDTIKIQKFSRGIKYVDFSGYRFIEQNRQKKSKWGKLAREGHNIMWIIKGRKYISQIMDGNYKTL